MAAILRRLQSCGIEFPAPCDDGTKTWVFSQKIGEKSIHFFRYIVKNHQVISAEYSVHCAQLAHDLLRKSSHELIEQIETALMMAELLEHIYRYYLIIPREVARIRREQNVYRQLLAAQAYQFIHNADEHHVKSSPSKTIRDLTATINLPRNFIGRLRRLLVTIAPVASDFARYRSFVNVMDSFAGPLLSYAGWICFTPRALTNLFLTCKHVVPGAWMGKQEKALGWQTRLRAQMERRWFELGNDLAWMTLGILSCFVLTGALAPIGFYGSAFLLAYDVGLASVRTHLELSRLKKLEAEYSQMLAEKVMSPDERRQMADYLIHLQRRIQYEKKRHSIQVINTCILLLAFSMAFPVFAFNPIIALVGATLAVLVTIACYIATQWVEKQKPIDKVAPLENKPPSVVPLSFFKRQEAEKAALHDDMVLNENDTGFSCA